MQTLEIIAISNANYQIKGELSFHTINKLTLKALKLHKNTAAISIDLQKISKIDSAGLALLIEWIKFAGAQQTELQFTNIPSQLTALANLSYLSETDLFTIK
ncbi:MAG: phospholipid transport system transporter-binding protein [Methyloprofundus sp.]|nr:MAG: phospholipid transport system transporter-binding protein [Methyloprofundus sp.]